MPDPAAPSTTPAERLEHDSLGAIAVPAARLWGAQTQRSLQHFAIGDTRMPRDVVQALVRIKRAAAQVNAALGVLDGAKAAAIVGACDAVLAGAHDAEFPLVVWQTGSGTQTNMNVNEVLANLASQALGGPVGEGRLVHPNDDVNRGQSSNDVFPSAVNIALTRAITRRLLPALAALRATLDAKARAFGGLVKIGRTHLQDATPITLGQEVSGWAAQLVQAARHLEAARPHLAELAIGGTAVGTGLNTHPDFGARVAAVLAQETGEPFVSAPNKFEALGAHDAVVAAHGALKTLAAALFKIANDVRWLASGPRAGLGELRLPENEPGSSIMPGKVNPTQSEALTMVCARVFGNDVAVTVGGASGAFQLNVFRPLLAHAALESATLLADAIASFDRHAMQGLEPVPERLAEGLGRSLMLVTALVPHIGYDAAAAIAKHAHRDGLTLRAAALASGRVSAEDFDRWVDPAVLLAPRAP